MLIMAQVLAAQLWFLLSSFFLLLSSRQFSAVADLMLHTCCGLSANLECRLKMCCTGLAENKDVKIRPLFTAAQLCRAISSQGMYRQSKKMLNGNISSTCPHNMVNVGPLTAEIGLRVWGTLAHFNGFRILFLAI